MSRIFIDIEFPKKQQSMCLKHQAKIGQDKMVCEWRWVKQRQAVICV